MRQVAGYPLWLGHAGDARDPVGLHAAGIEAVVDLALDEAPATPHRALVYCRVPLVDGEGNPPWRLRAAVAAVATLLREGVPTLVVCGAGLSRTPAVAGVALALVRGCPPEQGLAIVAASGRSDVTPTLWRDLIAATT